MIRCFIIVILFSANLFSQVRIGTLYADANYSGQSVAIYAANGTPGSYIQEIYDNGLATSSHKFWNSIFYDKTYDGAYYLTISKAQYWNGETTVWDWRDFQYYYWILPGVPDFIEESGVEIPNYDDIYYMSKSFQILGSPEIYVEITSLNGAGMEKIRVFYNVARDAKLFLPVSSMDVGTIHSKEAISGKYYISNVGAVSDLFCKVSTSNTNYDLNADLYAENEFYANYISPGNTVSYNFYGQAPYYSGPFVHTILFTPQFFAGSEKIFLITGNVAIPDFCFRETTSNSLSMEETLFDSTFVDFSKKQKTKLSDNKLSLEEKMKFAYDYFKYPQSMPIDAICKSIIKKYPRTEMGISFYALDILKQFYEKQNDKDSYYKFLEELSSNQDNYINAWAGILLACSNKATNKLNLLDNIYKKYKNSRFGEMSLFLKFLHFYYEDKDKVEGRSILKELDKYYSASYYSYNAHLLVSDSGYTSKGLSEIEEKENQRLKKLAKDISKDRSLFEETLKKPVDFEISNNFPNPFNSSTNILVNIPKNQSLRICIYNSLGQLIKKLVDEELTAGEHKFEWTGLNESNEIVSSGIYFYQVSSGNNVFTRKMILQK